MRALLLAGSLLLCGCGKPAPAPTAFERQVRLANEMLRVRLSMDPCSIHEDNSYGSRRLRDCVALLPQQRIRGIWYVGFEESGFVRDAATAPAVRVIGPDSVNPEFDIFLEIEDRERLLRRLTPHHWPAETMAIALDFVGRRSRHTGSYYASDHGHVVVVDRLISARLLGAVRTRIILPGCTGACAGPR